ncbi:GFA family protein [Methylophaga sp. OBS4]|uniref:GFA family protein n=1 Tax=Methylophaga sp. OBS4 TaxID=2991935 RepID=UPI00225714F3|nr:GFA family protein [Methylophaga sp. OBS4]MCX4188360.1 GFA family protein [Methylophaga sp. OBS4]
MLKGSCLCQQVQYQIDGTLGPVFFCHCSKCRKANGSAFAANALINTAEFSLLSGQDALNEFESSPGVFRVFCKHCASPLYSRRDAQAEQIRLRIGSLDTPLGELNVTHIFVGSKADWFEICDSYPQYKERP